MSLTHIPTEFQEANILNKAMQKHGFEFIRGEMGMMDIYLPA